MKKLIIILSLFVIILNSYGQRDIWIDTFNIAILGGTDTVLYKANEDVDGDYRHGFGEQWGIEFEVKAIGAGCNDAIIDIGFSQDGTTFTSFSSITGGSIVFPYIVTGADSSDVNGVQKLTVGDYSGVFAFEYFAIKITKGSCTEGNITWKLTQKNGTLAILILDNSIN